MPHFTKEHENPSEGASVQSEDARSERIRTKNRRMRYLDLNPNYFKQHSLELADPLLYDRLIRRFQTASERENEGRERGYSGVLEANLVRSEAKLEALQHPDPNSPMVYSRAVDGSITGVEQDDDDRAVGRADGWEKWKSVMGLRFIRGDDGDFEYAAVDEDEGLDDRGEEERTKLEEYLDAEEESFVGEGSPIGQTGVQDY
ncbi:hypothetical protein LTR37_004029 [Vermiconidia calcicola]|uniref:Uncharacterized protein n=1 Tax=Vermiconidia calcicola TaxID=1690605 RepID=A0ACC3NMT7_9PEZI|nr:hypothetical protein LTR37_004029 [Vermiconidia calcicola]